MDKTTFTIAEIMDAFAALKARLEGDCGEGAGEERYLIDDVAIDVAKILRGDDSDGGYERELDDDEALFVGQNYGYFREEVW